MSNKEKYRDMPSHDYKSEEISREQLKVVRNPDRIHRFDSQNLSEYLLPLSPEDDDVIPETSETEPKNILPQPEIISTDISATNKVAKKEPPNLNGYRIAKMYVSRKSLILYMDNLFVYVKNKGYIPINDKALQRDINTLFSQFSVYLITEGEHLFFPEHGEIISTK